MGSCNRCQNGFLEGNDLKVLVEQAFPDLWQSAAARPHLVVALEPHIKCGAQLSFSGFVDLARQLVHLREHEINRNEAETIQAAGFTFDEVHALRATFITAMGERQNGCLSFVDLQNLMSSLGPLGSSRLS